MPFQDQDPFELVPSEDAPAKYGRPKGARNKRSAILWQLAECASPEILEQRIAEAKKLGEYMEKGDLDRARIAVHCGDSLLLRTFPKPRSTPVQIDINQFGTGAILAALASGEISPSDAAALIRVSGDVNIPLQQAEETIDARMSLADRVQKAIAAREAREHSTAVPVVVDVEAVSVPEPADPTTGTETATNGRLDLNAVAEQIRAIQQRLDEG